MNLSLDVCVPSFADYFVRQLPREAHISVKKYKGMDLYFTYVCC